MEETEVSLVRAKKRQSWMRAERDCISLGINETDKVGVCMGNRVVCGMPLASRANNPQQFSLASLAGMVPYPLYLSLVLSCSFAAFSSLYLTIARYALLLMPEQ